MGVPDFRGCQISFDTGRYHIFNFDTNTKYFVLVLTAIPIPIPNHMAMWPGSIWAFLPHLNVRLRHSYGKKFFHKICDSYFCTHEL